MDIQNFLKLWLFYLGFQMQFSEGSHRDSCKALQMALFGMRNRASAPSDLVVMGKLSDDCLEILHGFLKDKETRELRSRLISVQVNLETVQNVRNPRASVVILLDASPDIYINETLTKHQLWIVPEEAVHQFRHKLRFDSNFWYYASKSNNSSFEMTKVYSSPKTNQLIEEVKDQTQMTVEPRNMAGDTLNVGFVEDKPLIFTSEKGEISGFHGEIIQMISQRLNFTPVFERNDYWAAKDKNGTWKGLVGGLASGHLDMGLSLSRTYDRSTIIDNSRMVGHYEQILLAHKSSISNNVMINHYYKTFNSFVWLCIAITLSLLACGIWSQSWASSASMITWKNSLQSIEAVFIIFTQNDPQSLVETSLWSQRVTFFVACLFAFIVSIVYSALLTAAMASSPQRINVRTMGELANSDLSIYLYAGSATLSKFKMAPSNTPKRAIYDNKISKDEKYLIKSLKEGVSKLTVDTRGVIFTFVYSLSQCGECYAVRGQWGPGASDTIGLQKGSALKDALDVEIMQMRESGLLEKLARKYGLEQQREFDVDNSVEPLGYKTVLLPFASLVLGGLISALAVCIERLKRGPYISNNNTS